ncbi:MAG: hypothetical protein A2X61_01980 [Ignavibacteria bacterium GWB2_35_12]|nr:MAG: hypothetical protein A2X63_01295 [Ignavibacteria bacterium GWA2_35_8]OGU40021.1 MAG: hypothetical protein A2X61_01980 [Ignavibacteria bacterium GWB2_35_12]
MLGRYSNNTKKAILLQNLFLKPKKKLTYLKQLCGINDNLGYAKLLYCIAFPFFLKKNRKLYPLINTF